MCRDVCPLVLHLLAGELDEWVVDAVARDHIHDLLILFVRAKTLLSLLRVVEEVAHLQSGAFLSSAGLRSRLVRRGILQLAVEVVARVAQILALRLAYDSEAGNVADRGESLPTESEAGHVPQVAELLDFACREPLAQNGKVFLLDAVPVVLDLQEAHAAMLAQNVDLSRTSIDRVFD